MNATTTIVIVALMALVALIFSIVRFGNATQRSRVKRIIDGLPNIKDPSIRLKAIEELAALDAVAAYEQLTYSLKGTSPKSRRLALNSLLVEAHEAVPRIEQAEREAARPQPNSLLYIYLKARERSRLYDRIDNFIVKGLIQALEGASASERDLIVSALRQLGTSPAVSAVDEAENEVSFESTRASVHYYSQASPNRWHPLLVYVYKLRAASEVATDLSARFPELPESRRAATTDTSPRIPPGAIIRATPQLAGFQIQPPHLVFRFNEDWRRLDFQVKAPADLLEQESIGMVLLTIEGIVIASLPLSIYVNSGVMRVERIDNARPIYQRIFCSYSHKDEHIVRRVESAARTLGMTYLRDVQSLRSGDNWSDKLFKLIEEADVFQLFWSVASSKSEAVENEWRYALLQGNRENFIRPVYWEKPLPPPPLELKHINFHYEPDLVR